MPIFSLNRPSGLIQSIGRFVRPSVRLSVCPSVCLFVRLFTFEVPFNGLFAPTSRSWMSNIFRDSESLGKSNGKKWSYILNCFFWKLSKIAVQKKFFFCWFFGPVSVRRLYNDMRRLYWDMRQLYWYDAGFGAFLVHPPMASVLLSASVERFSVSRMRDF